MSTAETVQSEINNVWPDLTTHDRCEGRTATGSRGKYTTCNAQAFVRYAKSFNSAGGRQTIDLVFCGHCHAANGMALELQGFALVQNQIEDVNGLPA